MYFQHVTLSTFSLILLFKLQHNYSKARYSLFVLKVPLNPNQSFPCLYGGFRAFRYLAIERSVRACVTVCVLVEQSGNCVAAAAVRDRTLLRVPAYWLHPSSPSPLLYNV